VSARQRLDHRWEENIEGFYSTVTGENVILIWLARGRGACERQGHHEGTVNILHRRCAGALALGKPRRRRHWLGGRQLRIRKRREGGRSFFSENDKDQGMIRTGGPEGFQSAGPMKGMAGKDSPHFEKDGTRKEGAWGC